MPMARRSSKAPTRSSTRIRRDVGRSGRATASSCAAARTAGRPPVGGSSSRVNGARLGAAPHRGVTGAAAPQAHRERLETLDRMGHPDRGAQGVDGSRTGSRTSGGSCARRGSCGEAMAAYPAAELAARARGAPGVRLVSRPCRTSRGTRSGRFQEVRAISAALIAMFLDAEAPSRGGRCRSLVERGLSADLSRPPPPDRREGAPATLRRAWDAGDGLAEAESGVASSIAERLGAGRMALEADLQRDGETASPLAPPST